MRWGRGGAGCRAVAAAIDRRTAVPQPVNGCSVMLHLSGNPGHSALLNEARSQTRTELATPKWRDPAAPNLRLRTHQWKIKMREVNIEWWQADPSGTRQHLPSTSASARCPPGHGLFAINLPYTASAPELAEHIHAAAPELRGRLRAVRLLTRRREFDTCGKCSCFLHTPLGMAKVVVATAEDASEAIACLDGKPFRSRPVYVHHDNRPFWR